MLKPYATINGREVFAERRRYSKSAVFTWLYVKIGEEFIQLGDPWQKLMPPRAEVAAEVARAEGGAK